MKNKTTKRISGLLLLLLLLVALSAGWMYHTLHSAAFAIDQPVAVYVDEQKDYSRLLSQLQSEAHLKNREVFDRLAQQMKYPSNM
ncbi:MAG: hypothetical protein LBB64_02665, partial [Dysgonamonadaceae bacterium]|nr:hypothetical protein [Dysgonamonadaceae bacterium]